MPNIIDKDVNLFLPGEFNYLLLGGNFLFSKRLYEILKRQYKIKRIDYKHNFTDIHFPCIDNVTFPIYLESFKKIQASIYAHNSDTLIFTSEILLFLSNENHLDFLSLLSNITKLHGIKIIFISIENPLHICKNIFGQIELSNMSSKKWYHERIKNVKQIINGNDNLIYEFSSYITYTASNLQTNPLELLNSNQLFDICIDEQFYNFSLSLADDIIYDIIQNSENSGYVTHTDNPVKTVNLTQIQNRLIDENLYTYVNTQLKCSLNLIYRKKPQEISNNYSIANWRMQLGRTLKQNIPVDIIESLDVIVPIPETGKYYAQGLASELNKPYIEAFYKQSEVGRSFDIKDVKQREDFINAKLGIIPDLIRGKTIGIVDEAIFTGQTLKIVSKLLQQECINNVYFFIASPVCNYRCTFNMQPDRELLSEHTTLNELPLYFKVNDVIFQDRESYKKIVSSAGFDHICCFNK